MKIKKSDLNLKNQIFFEKIMIFINPELIRTELHISTKQWWTVLNISMYSKRNITYMH